MAEVEPSAWQLDAIAAQLKTSAAETRELGQPEPFTRFVLGDATFPAHLDLWPERSRARITTTAARIELADIAPPQLAPSGVIFRRAQGREQLQLQVTAAGDIALTVSPTEALPTAITRAVPAAPAATTPTPEAGPATERQDRVTLRGRIGSPPRFERTKTGKDKGEFALYTRTDEQDIRHSVFVFGERATRLQAKALKVGDVVDVIAYPHPHTIRRRDGTSKEIVDLYATAVRRVTKPTPHGSSPEA